MTQKKKYFDALLYETKALFDRTAELRDFISWPDIIDYEDFGNCPPIPAANIIAKRNLPTNPSLESLYNALCEVAPFVRWRRTYSAEEVGQHFLDHYGWFELIGPGGHYLADDIRLIYGYWDQNLYYDWHLHRAEEIYFPIAGSATFHAENEEDALIGPGMLRHHKSFQPHAMTTKELGVLTLIIWRAPGLHEGPVMGRKITEDNKRPFIE